MCQPPDAQLLADALDRARRDLDDDTATWIGEAVTRAWHASAQHGPHQGQWAALDLLYQAAHWRQQGVRYVPDVLSACAEACVMGWAGEVTVQSGLAELELV